MLGNPASGSTNLLAWALCATFLALFQRLLFFATTLFGLPSGVTPAPLVTLSPLSRGCAGLC